MLLRAAERRELDRIDDERNQRAPGRPLHRLGVATMIGAAPQLAELFKTVVPDDFWAVTADRTAMISCPCGGEPTVRLSEIVECQGEKCGRFYLYVGTEMRVSPSIAEPESEPVVD